MEGLAALFLKAFFAAVVGFALKLIQQQQAQATAIALGGSQVVAQTNQAAAEAERRAQDAMAAQPDVDGMLADLEAGRFV